jgi:hypothetical protein
MDAALLTPSKYIKAVSLGGKDRTVTITGVKVEELEKDDKTKEQRGLVALAETTKKWVLNVTNVKCLIALFGRETNNWVNKRVTLYPERNEMSDSGFAIRVRGSPDIKADIRFVLKLARKKPRTVVLKAIGKNGAPISPIEPEGDEPAPENEARDPGDLPPDAEPPPSDPNEPPLFADEGEQPRA